ncbi:MAG: hypothetical protein CVV23_06545 [Ignavibacteriae bacterium HGW-Ignavibacteriae-2]|jgi:hypothetical protein|nr:hypothetical protein [Bacteroidota bacterium]PKL89149.1 MAG: hypothetical protein CVV23_06545 [Ignavibacteriae bacterium HGW-Ignavibacteriae-2]
MKTELFTMAIQKRCKLHFLYDLKEIYLDPYYITQNKAGKKVIFGRLNSSFEVAMFEYERIVNIKVLDNSKFSPIIPIMPIAS